MEDLETVSEEVAVVAEEKVEVVEVKPSVADTPSPKPEIKIEKELPKKADNTINNVDSAALSQEFSRFGGVPASRVS